eukprot:GHVH01008795.1.p1 GENE.GHVH01008795.1~~GHVH01008795.1.p1  ORF type:complete len:462 (+),score=57.61 GHVH01008795.1:99-1484(+)
MHINYESKLLVDKIDCVGHLAAYLEYIVPYLYGRVYFRRPYSKFDDGDYMSVGKEELSSIKSLCRAFKRSVDNQLNCLINLEGLTIHKEGFDPLDGNMNGFSAFRGQFDIFKTINNGPKIIRLRELQLTLSAQEVLDLGSHDGLKDVRLDQDHRKASISIRLPQSVQYLKLVGKFVWMSPQVDLLQLMELGLTIRGSLSTVMDPSIRIDNLRCLNIKKDGCHESNITSNDVSIFAKQLSHQLLHIELCSMPDFPTDLFELKQLKSINIKNCGELDHIFDIDHYPNLVDLCIENTSFLRFAQLHRRPLRLKQLYLGLWKLVDIASTANWVKAVVDRSPHLVYFRLMFDVDAVGYGHSFLCNINLRFLSIGMKVGDEHDMRHLVSLDRLVLFINSTDDQIFDPLNSSRLCLPQNLRVIQLEINDMRSDRCVWKWAEDQMKRYHFVENITVVHGGMCIGTVANR